MPSTPSRAAVELALAALVCLLAVVTSTGVPRPYPTRPSVGPVPLNPELLVPGAFALVVLAGAARDLIAARGRDLPTLALGALGVVTLWLAAVSWLTLYTPSRGGVFFGGLFTLVSGVALALGVGLRRAAGADLHRRGVRRVRRALGR